MIYYFCVIDKDLLIFCFCACYLIELSDKLHVMRRDKIVVVRLVYILLELSIFQVDKQIHK